MRIEEAIELINEISVQDLKSLNRDELMFIVDGMNMEDRSRFFMEKNVKVFGGIDGYVADFLDKVNLNSMNIAGKTGARAIMNKMLGYPGISEESRNRVKAALARISYEAAPAAGGRRKSRRKARKARGLNHTRVRK